MSLKHGMRIENSVLALKPFGVEARFLIYHRLWPEIPDQVREDENG